MDYIFDFEQKKMVDLKLSIKEVLIIFYLKQFFDSGNALLKIIAKKSFYLITYKKILSDLPILEIKTRQLERLLIKLEEKRIIEKRIINRRMYIYINQDRLYFDDDSETVLTNEDVLDINKRINQKSPTFVKYYRKRVKILFKDNPSVTAFGGEIFLKGLKRNMKFKLSKTHYLFTMKDAEIEAVTNNMIVIYIPRADTLNDFNAGALDRAVNHIFKKVYIID